MEKKKSLFIPGIQESEQAELLRVCSVGLTFFHLFVSSHISQTLSVYYAVQKRCMKLARQFQEFIIFSSAHPSITRCYDLGMVF